MLLNIREAYDKTPFDVDGRGLQSTTGLFRFTFPSFRYEVWDAKDVQTKATATVLKYNASSWNYETFNDVENLCYEPLPFRMKNAATNMGFTEEVWDCFINHYIDYDWSDLMEEGIHGYVMDLGWTEQLWMSNGTTASEDLYWDELSQTERDAAWALCYFEETWNGELSLDQWPAGFPTRP